MRNACVTPAAYGDGGSTSHNPFNRSTEIRFRLVDTLADTEMAAGEHSVVWHAEQQASGAYMYRIAGGGFGSGGRCLLLK